MKDQDLIAQLAQAEQDIRLLTRQLREQRELRLKLLGAIEYSQQKENSKDSQEEDKKIVEEN